MNSDGTPAHQVVFPRTPDGRRSSSALGRAVLADALRAADPAAAEAAEREPDWRRGYLRHFRALVEAGLGTDGAGYDIAAAGLASVHARMRVTSDAGELTLAESLRAEPDRPLSTVTVTGSGTPEREVSLPYRGDLLRGDALHRRLDAWVAAGTIEPSCAEAVRQVAANPDWLDLSDQQLVVLGAGAEMGPLPAVLGWGGTVVGVDLPRPAVWARLAETAEKSAGRLICPVAGTGPAGADLLGDLPAVAQWLLGIDGRLVLGNYVYAPGASYVPLTAAVDALTTHVRAARPDAAVAMLATPTDVFAVPGAAVAESRSRYRGRSGPARTGRVLSGGRMLLPQYPDDADPGISDNLVPQQGPNYALAKRIQRWRATVARRETVACFGVAPPTRTRSVVNNRLLAAAYAGAHLFGVEIFAPVTANTLMALLLVHALRNPRAAGPAVWRDEAFAAAHGGLWRMPYQIRTSLPLAAVRGLPAALR
ncbi:hypothetical protein [Jidongwangia harbinensis]|uniref:hypothetical protein n=1 Tax=Jidongwangia harbinensis TaxID=2878561 RepID=UPI001CD99096|nr:hypothetical protein [Jidongwangia harbinensis]MCA2217704.1 hypothetical protein [Jidongwangia harbinensis]